MRQAAQIGDLRCRVCSYSLTQEVLPGHDSVEAPPGTSSTELTI